LFLNKPLSQKKSPHSAPVRPIGRLTPPFFSPFALLYNL
jgi:hypothetical protein